MYVTDSPNPIQPSLFHPTEDTGKYSKHQLPSPIAPLSQQPDVPDDIHNIHGVADGDGDGDGGGEDGDDIGLFSELFVECCWKEKVCSIHRAYFLCDLKLLTYSRLNLVMDFLRINVAQVIGIFGVSI